MKLFKVFLIPICFLSANVDKFVLQEFWFIKKQSVLTTCKSVNLRLIRMNVMETIAINIYCLHGGIFCLELVSLLP